MYSREALHNAQAPLHATTHSCCPNLLLFVKLLLFLWKASVSLPVLAKPEQARACALQGMEDSKDAYTEQLKRLFSKYDKPDSGEPQLHSRPCFEAPTLLNHILRVACPFQTNLSLHTLWLSSLLIVRILTPTGFVHIRELHGMLRSLDARITRAEVQSMQRSLDPDGTGNFTLEQFLAIVPVRMQVRASHGFALQ